MLQTYSGDGMTSVFTVGFPFLSRTHVFIRVDGYPTTATWPSDSSVDLGVPPPSGAVVTVQRHTPDDAGFADIRDTTTMTAEQLRRLRLQLLYRSQELATDLLAMQSALQPEIDALSAQLSGEVAARLASEAILGATAVSAATQAGIAAANDAVTAQAGPAVAAAIAGQFVPYTAIADLQASIAAEGVLRTAADAALGQSASAETSARQGADLGLQGAIDSLAASVQASGILTRLLTVDGTGSGLDADLLDGQDGLYYRDLANSTGTLPTTRLVGTYPIHVSGNAGSATQLSIARTIGLTGDLMGSAPFDGTLDAMIPVSLPLSGAAAGTYGTPDAIPVLSVDVKGRVTSASAVAPRAASDLVAGVVKLSSSTGDISTTLAATPAAVKSAYDLASAAGTASAAAQAAVDSEASARAAADTVLQADLATLSGALAGKQDSLGFVPVNPATIPTFSGGAGGTEGGEIHLLKPPTSTLAGDLVVDLLGDSLRLFENGGSARGAGLTLTRCAAGAGSQLALLSDLGTSRPSIVVGINAGTALTWNINSSWGVFDTVYLQNKIAGVFASGGGVGSGYFALAIQATGIYAITLRVYNTGTTVPRLTLVNNLTAGIGFVQPPPNPYCVGESSFLAALSAGDALSYVVASLGALTAHHAQHHTQLSLVYLGT